MQNILLQQKAERDQLLARAYLPRTTRYDSGQLLASPLIKLITGPRRAGKSVFALQMLQGQNFAYLNFDDSHLLEKWDEDIVLGLLGSVYPGFSYLLLDEVQNLPNWDLMVSKLYRRGTNLIITGSNAKMLSSEMATVLTGRYLPIELLPFSLGEAGAIPVTADEYLHNGGFPETLTARQLTAPYLSSLFDSILLKDVARRHRVRNTADLYNLATYLLTNFTNPVTANSLSRDLDISSVATVKKFCAYLTEPYLFFFLPKFDNKVQIMEKAPKKVYVADNGFVESSAFATSQNLGRLLENQVFVELLRRGYVPGLTLFYYRTRNDKEIDFVTLKGAKPEELIQVCYDVSEIKTQSRELKALTEASSELRCDRLTLVTMHSPAQIIKNGDKEIRVVPVEEF